MNCTDIGSELTLYADGVLDEAAAEGVSQHLDQCPLCREKMSELREVRVALRRMKPVETPPRLKLQLRRAIADEMRVQKTSWLPVSAVDRAWLRTAVMPYAVGTVASLVIGFTVLTMMFSGIRNRNALSSQPGGSDSILLASNRDPFSSRDLVSPTEFA